MDATWTYRYLRLAMLGAVLLLSLSILIEVERDGWCVQHSISAYYHTPARAVFVSVLLVIGVALVAYQGTSTLEDVLLNVAGMFAPFVAFVPTTGADCGSNVVPIDSAAVQNNVLAYLLACALGLIGVTLLGLVLNRGPSGFVREAGRSIILPWSGNVAVLLVMGLLFWARYDDFDVHGWSAVAMFVLLAAAVACKAVEHRRRGAPYFHLYTAIAAGMVAGGLVIAGLGTLFDWARTILFLEAWEIALFVAFWGAQTIELWPDEPAVEAPEDRPLLPAPETL